MKKTFMILIIYFTVYNAVYPQLINTWKPIYHEKGNLTANGRNNSIVVLDEDNILLVDQFFANTSPFLAVTNDGGIKWDTLFKSNAFEYEINSFAYPDKKNIVWVGDTTEYLGMVGYNSYFKKTGVLFKSTNSGMDWTKIKLDSNSSLDCVFMLNDSVGIAVRKNSGNLYNNNYNFCDTLLYTTDFFDTYSKIPIPDSMAYVDEIKMLSSSHFLIFSNSPTTNVHQLLETTDKGATWTPVFDLDNYYDYEIIDRMNMYRIIGEKNSGTETYISKVYKTTDGGKNWEFVFTPSDPNWLNYVVSRIDAYDIDNAIVVGSNGAIFRTSDGGANWSKEFIPNLNGGFTMEYDNLSSIIYLNRNAAYIIGGVDGYLFKADGTKTLSRPQLNKYNDRANPVGILAFWNKVEGALSYRFQLAINNSGVYSDNTFDNIIFDTLISSTQLVLPDLEYNNCYYGRVKAINDEMESEWCIRAAMFCTFKSDNYTDAPKIIYPALGAIVNENPIKIIWKSVAGAEEYEFQISDNPYFVGDELQKFENLIDTSIVINNLVYDKEYVARVRISKGVKVSDWTFTTFTLKDNSGIISSNETNIFLISPNPATDYIEVQVPNNVILSGLKNPIKIYNTMGECVINLETNNFSSLQKINVSALPTGIYFLKVGNEYSKFVKVE